MTLKSAASKIRSNFAELGNKFGALKFAPSRSQAQAVMFLLGVTLLTTGIAMHAGAQALEGATYNDDRIANSVNTLLLYLEGSFGALVMVAAGIGAILSSAFGQYRAALGCLVVAVGAFILRSFLNTFFNTEHIEAGGA
ncbi:MAG: hypothetical protein K1X83_04000 [Oligoflexia bacterium]|nr:hypothetical protein [Oligoflexia bacterium]